MTRGRKLKIDDSKTISFILEMSKFSTSLQDVANFVEKGCGIVLTLPTVRALLIRELGDDAYNELSQQWSEVRNKGSC